MLKSSLYERVFGNSFSDVSTGENIDKLIEQYPWFSLGHFYKLKSTALTDTHFKKIAPLAAIYFNNPYLLNQRLQQTGVSETKVPSAVLPDQQEHEVDHPLPIVEPVTDNLPHEHALEQDSVTEEKESVASIEPVEPESSTPAPEKNETEALPLFEPLHASDYFASQGIKLSEENLGDDQLGKKMRRFTDWLKTMKKTPLQESNITATGEDQNVTNLANRSNEDSEVITEAMANVLAQQGKLGKAKEIYEKLKLINPDKSAYFAAKIENLNEK